MKIAISKKSYADFVDRIHNVFNNRPEEAHEVITLMENHIAGTKYEYDLSCSSEDVKIAFTILIPEIEKAMMRSQRAREAAAQRNKARKQKPTKDKKADENIPLDSISNASTAKKSADTAPKVSAKKCPAPMDTIKLNRAERRQFEQEERREKRKWMKQLAKWRKEFKSEMNKTK